MKLFRVNKNTPYKIAFFGTPEFSVPTLKALYESKDFEVVLVVSQPDRPAGRNLKLTPSPVKEWALKNNLPVVTPETCKTSDFIDDFINLNIDAAVVVAFGQILNQKLLDVCPQKFINIHASLLPRWRGAAPIQRAVMLGDKTTGVSAQVMVKKLDAGDVIFETVTDIRSDENSIELHDRLSSLAAGSIVSGFKSYLQGELNPRAQDESLVNYAAKIEKNETWIDWSKSADEIWNHIRGLALGPGGASMFKGKRLKIIKAKPLSFLDIKSNPALAQFIEYALDQKVIDKKTNGEVVALDAQGFFVVCQQSFLYVTEVQPESKPVMKSKDFMNGFNLKTSDMLVSLGF